MKKGDKKIMDIKIKNVDIELLKIQKESLIDIRSDYRRGTLPYERLSGIIHFLDDCIDSCADTPGDPCPLCHFEMIAGPNGSSICSNDNCSYWRLLK